MSTSLRNTINDLASSFAASILDALRGMSLEEILAATSGSSGVAKRGPGRPRTVAVHVASAAPAAAGESASARGGKRGRRARAGRLNRRSAGDIHGLIDQIVAVLEAHPAGLRAEQIRAQLSLEAKELPRPIAEALATRRISKEGQKRATTYFAKGGGGAAKAAGGGAGAKRAGKKVAAKAPRGKKAAGGKRGRKSAQAAAATNGAPAT